MFGLIRYQLTIIICSLITLTLALVLMISYYMVSADYEKKMHYYNAVMAESLAANIVQFMGNAYTVTELVATYPDIYTLPPAKQLEVLQDTKRRFPFYQLLIVHKLNGDQISRTSGVLSNRADRWWFKKFMTDKRAFVSKTYYSVASESPITTIVHGINSGGELSGLLMADIEIDTLQQMVERFSSGEGSYAYLLDGQGVVVAHPDRNQVDELYNYRTMKKSILIRDPKGYMLKDAKGNEKTEEVDFAVAPSMQAIVAKVMDGGTGVGEYTDLNGEENICAYREISLPGASEPWSLIVVQKKSAALAFMKDVTVKIAFVGLGVLVFSALLTLWFSRRITRPLIEMVHATNKIKEGDLAVRLEDAAENEIGVLATNFNQMISELRQHRESLENLAFHDALTGLPNRARLNLLLEDEMAKARIGLASGIILFIDMDDLKSVNDNFGHTFGDKVIIEASRHIVDAVGEQAVVARIGGDEFIVVLSGDATREKAGQLACQAIRELCHEYEVSVEQLHMSASIGVVVYPEDGDQVEDVLKKADSAMYAAKQAGRNCWRFYEPVMLQETYEKMMLTNGLRRALERGELYLHYQPQFAMPGERIVGFEALLRWNSAEFGLVPPDRFIPLAEQSGLILPIGEWVLREACRFARRLANMGNEDIHISVNISPRQLIADDFVAIVCANAEQAGIKPQQLEIEITESVLIESLEDSVVKLRQLREMGVTLSLDDFGTGYSSLTYLMSLPVGILKIDRSFIAEIATERVQLQLVGSMIDLGHALGLTIVAEGVETENQLALLLAIGCDRIQGYIFSRPIPEEAAIQLVLPKTI
ncbi:MAG: EAL domain-containing protein [Negativicutes bacterium]|nr:EAL domain-containing protein [Negativicutes bacterium]